MTDSSSLFRQEVILQQSSRGFGNALVQTNAWSSRVVLTAVLLAMAALVLLVLTRYKETETVRGLLVASGGAHRVVAPTASTIKQILVKTGDKVAKGQVLAALIADTFDQHGNSTQQEMLQQFRVQQRILLDEKALQNQLFQQQRAQLLNSIEDSVVTDELIASESNLLHRQLQLKQENLNALETLAQSRAITRLQLQQAQLDYFSFQLRVQEAAQRRQANQTQIDTQQAQLANLKIAHDQAQLGIDKELQQLTFTIAQATNQSQLTVVAETDGVVSTVAITPDERVNAQQPLFYITSHPELLEASLYVPSRVLGQLYPGQELLLDYDAFDFEFFGRYRATITAIDQGSLDPREHLLPLPGIQEPVFRVTAQIEQSYVEGSDVYRLQSGMLFSANVVMADMSLLAFIFRPVLRTWARLS